MNNITLDRNTKDPKVLDELSKNEDYYVRRHIALNPNTSPETLDYLSRDEDYHVRRNVTENTNTSPETLKQMAIDKENDYIKSYIKNNPNCSEETGRYLLAVNVVQDIMCNVEGKI